MRRGARPTLFFMTPMRARRAGRRKNMQPIQKLIYAGFATAALASASLPAVSGASWPVPAMEWSQASAAHAGR